MDLPAAIRRAAGTPYLPGALVWSSELPGCVRPGVHAHVVPPADTCAFACGLAWSRPDRQAVVVCSAATWAAARAAVLDLLDDLAVHVTVVVPDGQPAWQDAVRIEPAVVSGPHPVLAAGSPPLRSEGACALHHAFKAARLRRRPELAAVQQGLAAGGIASWWQGDLHAWRALAWNPAAVGGLCVLEDGPSRLWEDGVSTWRVPAPTSERWLQRLLPTGRAVLSLAPIEEDLPEGAHTAVVWNGPSAADAELWHLVDDHALCLRAGELLRLAGFTVRLACVQLLSAAPDAAAGVRRIRVGSAAQLPLTQVIGDVVADSETDVAEGVRRLLELFPGRIDQGRGQS